LQGLLTYDSESGHSGDSAQRLDAPVSIHQNQMTMRVTSQVKYRKVTTFSNASTVSYKFLISVQVYDECLLDLLKQRQTHIEHCIQKAFDGTLRRTGRVSKENLTLWFQRLTHFLKAGMPISKIDDFRSSIERPGVQLTVSTKMRQVFIPKA
jgi:hypothetical protein